MTFAKELPNVSRLVDFIQKKGTLTKDEERLWRKLGYLLYNNKGPGNVIKVPYDFDPKNPKASYTYFVIMELHFRDMIEKVGGEKKN